MPKTLTGSPGPTQHQCVCSSWRPSDFGPEACKYLFFGSGCAASGSGNEICWLRLLRRLHNLNVQFPQLLRTHPADTAQEWIDYPGFNLTQHLHRVAIARPGGRGPTYSGNSRAAHHRICGSLVDHTAFNTSGRTTRSEVKFVSTVSVAATQRKADDLAREYRELDTRIQEADWLTTLLD